MDDVQPTELLEPDDLLKLPDGDHYELIDGVPVEKPMGAESDEIASSIAAEADRHASCAVVVGSRGLGRVKAQLLGSTSHGVLMRARQPVLIVRHPAGAG